MRLWDRGKDRDEYMKTTIMLLWAMGLAWCRKGGGDIYQQTLISAPHSPPPRPDEQDLQERALEQATEVVYS